MSAGESRLSTTSPAHAFWGMAWLELYFRRYTDPEWTSILHPEETRAAAVCSRCGGMWVAPRTAPPDDPVP
jgi:hypothetical protein